MALTTDDDYVTIPKAVIEHEANAHQRYSDEARRLQAVLTDLAKLVASPGGIAAHADAATTLIQQASHKRISPAEDYIVVRKAMLEDGAEETRHLREVVANVGHVLDRAQADRRSTLSPVEIKELRQQIEGVRQLQQQSVEQSHSRGIHR